MEKEQFLFLAQHYTSLSSEETIELEAVQQQYPYCQLAHILTARGAQNNKLDSFQKQLHLSAVYAADRGVLKTVLAAPFVPRTSSPALGNSSDPGTGFEPHAPSALAGDDLINEVMADLSRLKELKHNFEVTLQDYDRTHPTEQTPVIQRGIKETTPKVKNEAKLPVAEPVPVTTVDDEPSGDFLLEEIKNKRKLQPEASRQKDQKEQIEIINQFIKKQPTIPRTTAPVVDTPDLAEKSISLTDNIVSETLVEILLRQGKKDKAIEVLKKLIWKFPQKKSIFAAQIEELRK